MKKSELWKQLVAEVGDEEVERAASVTRAEAEAELRAAGFDVAAERARAEAFLDALANREATPRAAPREGRRGLPPAVVLFGTAALAAAAGAALYATTHRPPEQPVAPLPPPTTPPSVVPTAPPASLVTAADLRRLAAADCDAHEWDACLAHLEEARALDPAGDDAPAVRKLRAEAIPGILKKPRLPRQP
jgi:hypothetical protein